MSFEFALVTGISLVSELRPETRATLIAFNAAAVSAGDAVGSFIGPRVYQGAIGPNVVLVVGSNLAAILLLLFFVREKTI
jgi:predicted MFS family arabinose efflux permease